MEIVKFIMIITMILLAVEDFRNREVSIFYIILFLVLVFGDLVINRKIEGEDILINTVIYFSLGISIMVYSFFKWGIKKRIVDTMIGKGDIIISFVFIFIFSPINFILFLDLSFLVGIVFFIFMAKNKKQVPLVGIFALIYLILLVVTFFQSNYMISFKDNYLNILLDI